jgi:hypothetical protein
MTTYTNTSSLAVDAWTDLGAGPLLVSCAGYNAATLVVADAGAAGSLATTLTGHPIKSDNSPVAFATTSHVYARALQAGGAIVVASKNS